MQWSQLKKRAESQFAPALNGRVQVWATLYRKPATTDGRGWITIDGEQVHSMADVPSDAAWRALGEVIDAAKEAEPGTPEADWSLRGENFFTHRHFRDDLEHFLNTSVDDMLADECPLVRALVRLDRRLGKRRFLRLEGMAHEHPLVRLLHRVRAEAEGWPLARDGEAAQEP